MGDFHWPHSELDSRRPVVIGVSPHPDDVALSATNAINTIAAQMQGAAFELITCFSQSQYTPYEDAYRGKDLARVRRNEDLAYLKKIRAKSVRLVALDLLDAPLRAEWPSENQLHDPRAYDVSPDAEIAKYARELRQILARRRMGDELILSPLGLGHKDHRIVSRASETLWSARARLFYEDAPYALDQDEAALRAQIQLLEDRVGAGLHPIRIVGDFDLRRWVECVGVYRSQFTAQEIEQIGRRLEHRGGERLWANGIALEWLSTRDLAYSLSI